MGDEEDKGARPVQKGSSSGKAPLVEPRDSVHGAAASQQDDAIDDAGSTECKHLETIKGMKGDPQCVDCQRGATAENLTLQEPKPRFVMCSGCSQCFCAGLASNEDGPMGHAQLHAKSVCHPVALWIDQPDAAYCFQCDHSLSLKQIALAARSHNHGYVVRGMPNCRAKCYVNALVQCLLTLGGLWLSMSGTLYPEGSLGVALKELFLETRAGNDAGGTLNTEKPGLPSSGHFLVTSDLPPAVTRAIHQEVCNSENLHVGEYLDPRSGDRDNARYHRVIEHHGRTVKGGHFVSEQEPSSSSSKAMHQEICSKEVPDVIREIASRLPCDIAVFQMARSSSAWAAALGEVGFHVPGAHARLPWLQMPHPTGPVFFCISCGGGASVQHTIGIAEDRRWTRYIGAFEGLWMVAAGTQIGGNMIFNLRSGASFRVPNEAVQGGSVQQLLLLATTLSSAPDKPNCIGMGIVKYMANLQQSRRVVFFTPGRETAIDHFPGEYFDEPEDLIYHESSFWLLTTNEHVHRWDMALQPDGDIALERWHGFLFHEHLDHGDYVVGRYIVPSRGELLMVVRLSSYSYGAGGETTKFCIYKMTVVDMGEGEDEPARCRWNELGSLAGRMLFIGRGCSRCYEASDYPSLTEGVYFSDGRTSFHAEGIVNNLEAPCSDNGRWSTQAPIVRCFPRGYHFSSYSSSGWVLQ